MKKQRRKIEMDTSSLKKKLITLVITIGTLFGIVSAAKYDNPKELIEDQLKQDKEVAIEETIVVQKANVVTNKIPVIIRSLFLLPLWAVGFVILNLLNKVVKLIGMPLLSFALSWFFLFLILLTIVVCFIKFLYPNLTLKQILSKKLIISLLICSFVMTLADKILLWLYKDYENIRKIIGFVLGLITLICLTINIIKAKIKDERKAKGIYVVE